MREISVDGAENLLFIHRMNAENIEYIHQSLDWPTFTWNVEAVMQSLATIRHRQGRLLGRMDGLGFSLRENALLETLTVDVVKSSEIEGEILHPDQVRSSIARHLGIEIAGLVASDRNVDGVVEMMLDATQRYAEPLTADRLWGWQTSIFPTGRSGLFKITVGTWRKKDKDPLRAVSGYPSRQRVHFEAPEAGRLKKEMKVFLDWFNKENDIDPVLKSGIAHLWFLTIHPFADGNGRIARALSDLMLARSEDSPQRFYSLSAQIRHDRNAYYEILEKTQRGNLDITAWLEWFLSCLNRAFDRVALTLQSVFKRNKFWDKHAKIEFNDRQRLLLNKLFDGFEGNLNSSKWAKIAKCSPDTALRDIQDLIEKSILVKTEPGGRSTSYVLKE